MLYQYTAFFPDESFSEFDIYGISNVSDNENPIYVANNVGDEATDLQNEITLDFIQYDKVSIGSGIATITNETTNEVIQLPIASVSNTNVSKVISRAELNENAQISQSLGNVIKDEGYYVIEFPNAYFLLGESNEKSPAFTLRFYATETSGIFDSKVDNDFESVLYTLQGVKVVGTPTAGVYVRVQGDNVTKVLIK